MKTLIKILPLAFICLGLSSCLDVEDPLTSRNTDDAPNIIEFIETPQIAASTESLYPVFVRSFDVVPDAQFAVTVSYSGTDVAPEDIVVNVNVNEGVLTAYNNKLVADARAAAMEGIEDPAEAAEAADDAEAAIEEELFDLAPASVYSVPNQVTIKKGERTATLTFAVKPSLFDFSFKYGIPVALSSDKAITSGNFGTAVFAVGAKNKYDGAYTYKFKQTATDRPTFDTSGNEWTWPGDVHLITTGPTSVKLFDSWGFATYIQPLRTADGWSGLGQTEVKITFDPATNNITSIVNDIVATNGRTFAMDPTGPNYFDPATKTVYATYFLNQTGFGPLRYQATFEFEGTR